MYIDSHCHLSYPELQGQLGAIRSAMRDAQVDGALCICTTMEEFESVQSLAQAHDDFWCSVGVHPDNEGVHEPTVDELLRCAQEPKVVAIGETGLDYYQMDSRKGGRSIADMEWQRERFRVHIRAAKQCGLPLVIHTREASDDTIAILKEEEGEGSQGRAGVFHCFTETQAVARAALDLGYFISFSGIVTFKSAKELCEVARFVPLDRMLIETDSPYLAPSPHRGKTNTPAYVSLVAEHIAALRGTSPEALGRATSDNFFRLFAKTQVSLTGARS